MKFAHSIALVSAVVASPAFAQGNPEDVTGPLVIYTSQPDQDAQQTVEAFNEVYPNVEVEWVRDGTTQMMARLRAEFEAGQPQPDVLLIADTVTMESLEQEDRLMPYTEADTSAYDDGLMDPEGHYFSTKLITTGIVYNTAAEMVPTSYADLLKPDAENNITMPSPLESGAATIHMVSLTGIDSLGWDFYQGLADQGAIAQGGNGGVYQAVAGGQSLYGFVVDFLALRNIQDGAPVGFVFPEEGVSAVTEPVAILKTAENVEAAKAFVDFLLSERGQELAAEQGYLPAHPGVAAPDYFPDRSEITVIDFDPANALENADTYRQRFTEMFGG
ncbi:iron(III) transport system substrate-binding protein [Palleronia marisminoris]|uniref:Iron deficiency-induced protein A n=1 Tax=Palleronia marisminoris TaxID=315423 RepID=A0A1Y5SJG4_9RHOB|nr:ABC transporter substrate-binding protein [Palleronia marisminoris]SFG85248.1 iron(III) transport system substrate-binding protein [Palleronia marisminoris]SLN42301.1 Iron deficiency-induced protein A precursor [Palleronia marisminoris]